MAFGPLERPGSCVFEAAIRPLFPAPLNCLHSLPAPQDKLPDSVSLALCHLRRWRHASGRSLHPLCLSLKRRSLKRRHFAVVLLSPLLSLAPQRPDPAIQANERRFIAISQHLPLLGYNLASENTCELGPAVPHSTYAARGVVDSLQRDGSFSHSHSTDLISTANDIRGAPPRPSAHDPM